MTRPTVVYFIEHVARELDVACAVKLLLAERHGIDAHVAQIFMDVPEVERTLHPRLVVLPFCYDGWRQREIWGFRTLWPGATFVNLTWEELYYQAHLKVKAPRGDFAVSRCLHHVWGEFFRDYLTSHGVPPENIRVNGNPAYQLYLPPYSAYFPDRMELARRHGLDPGRRWLFFPENYKWAFVNDDAAAGLERLGLSREEFLTMRDFCRRSLVEALRWCAAAADRGVEVVFRPRPATLRRTYTELFSREVGELPERLHILKEGSVREWVLAGDVVVSSFSTTLVEAAIAGKPAYMVEPIPLPAAFHCDWYRHVERLTSRERLVDAALGQAPAGEELRAWAMSGMLSGGDPIEGLADWIAELHGRHAARHREPVVGTPENRLRRALVSWARFLSILRTRFRVWRGRIRGGARDAAPWHAGTKSPTGDRRPGPPALPTPIRQCVGFVRHVVHLYRRATPENSAHREVDRFTEEEVGRRIRRWREVLVETPAGES